jgi:high affinity Mn2+ porin
MRLGWEDGRTEAWSYTEIDRTASFGLSLKGTGWSRPDDTFGLAGVINGLSHPHRDYLAGGGTGFMLGDGALNYGYEQILEMYYNYQLRRGLSLAFDYQFVQNPGYNKDRGPVHIFAGRIHWEF